MTLYGIQSNPKPNRLSPENFEGLPLPIFKGQLSLSLSFEGFPTGSFSAESISEEEIQTYRDVYQVGFKFVLLGNLYLEVASYAETEDLIYVSIDNQIRTYSVSINLRSANEIRANTPVEVRSNTRNQLGFGPNLTINGRLNAASVAGAVGLVYSGYSFSKTIESKAASFKVNFSSLIQEELRLNLQVIDWTGKSIRTKNYRTGANWFVTSHDINYSVETSAQQQSQFLNTSLTGKDGLPFLPSWQIKRLALKDLLGTQQTRKEPFKLTTEEGDINPTIPPYDVRKLRSLDMNFDFSGPRKTLKRTTTRNGQPFIEEIFTYGFVYLAQDIRNPAAENETGDINVPAIKSDSPGAWWKLIEYQKTEYVYKKGDITATVVGKEYEKIGTDSEGKDIKRFTGKTYQGQVQGSRLFDSLYLTEISTTGWKLARFQQEQFDEFGTDQNSLDSRWLTDEINFLSDNPNNTSDDETDLRYYRACLSSITFRKVPFVSKTQYHLVPATDIYNNTEPTPFQTQIVTKKSLGDDQPGEVLIAIPDPSYVFPLKVLEERTLTQSFAQMDHPQNIYIREDRKEVLNDNSLSDVEKREELKDLKLLPSLTTGEDTFRSVLRKVLPSKNTQKSNKISLGRREEQTTDIYLEFESNASHNDHNFQYSLQEKVFKTITGQLPDATVFNYELEGKETRVEEDPRNAEYRLSTTSRVDLPIFSDSLQYNTISLEVGLAAARCELELDNFLSSRDVNLNLAWFYPDVRPGDYITVVDDGSKGNLRVKNISFTIDYQGYVNGELLKTCSGTNLTCGEMPTQVLQSRKIKKDGTELGVDIKATIKGAPMFGANIVPNLQTRRNPSGDATEEATGSRL